MDLVEMRTTLKNLRSSLHTCEECDLKLVLHETVPDYSPFLVPWDKLPARVTNLEGYSSGRQRESKRLLSTFVPAYQMDSSTREPSNGSDRG